MNVSGTFSCFLEVVIARSNRVSCRSTKDQGSMPLSLRALHAECSISTSFVTVRRVPEFLIKLTILVSGIFKPCISERPINPLAPMIPNFIMKFPSVRSSFRLGDPRMKTKLPDRQSLPFSIADLRLSRQFQGPRITSQRPSEHKTLHLAEATKWKMRSHLVQQGICKLPALGAAMTN